MTEKYLLGIDIGTQGTKVVVIDYNGRVILTTQVSYSFETPQQGWTEQNPELWWDAVIKCLNELWEKGIDPETIKAVGAAGQMHSLVVLDDKGDSIRPAILWNDGRTKEECLEMEALIGENRLFDIIQNPVLPGFTAPKLLWLRKNEPDHFSRIKKMLMPKDYIAYQLTGKFSADVSDASGTCLMNVKKREWAWDIIEELGFSNTWFPPLYESKDVVGEISIEAARVTGLPVGILVVAGAGDNAAAALGNGIFEEKRGNISIGTSGTVFVPLKELPDVKREEAGTLHLFCHSLPGTWHAMGTTLSAGMSLKWAQKLFEKNSYEELLEGADRVAPGAEGLLFFPYLNGERTPLNNPDAKGVFWGLTYEHSRESMARAVIEGVCFSLRDVFDMMRTANIDVNEWTATGGAIKNQLWTAILADIFQQPLKLYDDREGPAFGGAILAGLGSGAWQDISTISEFFGQSETIDPQLENKEIYEQQFDRYQIISKTLNPLF